VVSAPTLSADLSPATVHAADNCDENAKIGALISPTKEIADIDAVTHAIEILHGRDIEERMGNHRSAEQTHGIGKKNQ
jgi:hypothetical protein